MTRAVKLWILIAVALIVLGVVLFAVTMTVAGWDFRKLGTTSYESNAHEITDAFDGISVKVDTTDVTVLPTDEEVCRVECYEQPKRKHTVSVQEGVLCISVEDERAWYEHIGIGSDTTRLTVYLPRAEYGTLSLTGSTGDVEISQGLSFKRMEISLSTGDLTSAAAVSEHAKITTDTGDISVKGGPFGALALSTDTGEIEIENIACEGKLEITVDTGDAELHNVSCKTLSSDGDTGDISLEKVFALEKLSVQRSTGEVSLGGCDAAELYIKTTTGDVEGSVLTEKIFVTQTDTGHVKVPTTTAGGKFEIITDTGDIEIEIRD